MRKKLSPLVIGNWKMNPKTGAEAILLTKSVAKIAKSHPATEVAIAVPALYLPLIKKYASGLRVAMQTAHFLPTGAHTGSLSIAMGKEQGVSMVILGHSERRATGETSEFVSRSALSALKAGITPVICVGEKERDTQAHFYNEVASDLKESLSGIPKARLTSVVIAYEPVWAIGSGVTPTTEAIEEMRLFIYKVLAETYGTTVANGIRVLYGGSVNAGNAPAFYAETGVNGFLVGGASLDPEQFKGIIQSTSV